MEEGNGGGVAFSVKGCQVVWRDRLNIAVSKDGILLYIGMPSDMKDAPPNEWYAAIVADRVMAYYYYPDRVVMAGPHMVALSAYDDDRCLALYYEASPGPNPWKKLKDTIIQSPIGALILSDLPSTTLIDGASWVIDSTDIISQGKEAYVARSRDEEVHFTIRWGGGEAIIKWGDNSMRMEYVPQPIEALQIILKQRKEVRSDQ